MRHKKEFDRSGADVKADITWHKCQGYGEGKSCSHKMSGKDLSCNIWYNISYKECPHVCTDGDKYIAMQGHH